MKVWQSGWLHANLAPQKAHPGQAGGFSVFLTDQQTFAEIRPSFDKLGTNGF